MPVPRVMTSSTPLPAMTSRPCISASLITRVGLPSASVVSAGVSCCQRSRQLRLLRSEPMWPLIGVLAALGLSANEPTALLVVLVVLRSGRNRGAGFVAGWSTALVVVTTGAGFIARSGLGHRRHGPRRVTLVIELVIGVALVIWATWYWLHNRGRAHPVEVPRILARLTSIRVVPAFFTGLLTATYPPAIVAGTTLLRSDASAAARVGGLVTFVLVGTVMVAAPVVGSYVALTWASCRSDAVFDWTLRHRRILLTTILVAVGAFVVVRSVLHLTHTGHH